MLLLPYREDEVVGRTFHVHEYGSRFQETTEEAEGQRETCIPLVCWAKNEILEEIITSRTTNKSANGNDKQWQKPGGNA